MINGETTKYHEAAKGIEGQRIAANPFNVVTIGSDEPLELAAASPPNVFGNISDQQNQRESNFLANSQGSNGPLSFGGTATAQRLGSGAQKAEKAEKDRKSFQDQAFQTLLLQIRALDRKIAWHGQEIERLTQQRDALDLYTEKLRRGERPEANTDVDAAIRAYEERYGVKVDRNDADQMAKVRGHTDGQISEHKKGKREAMRKRDDLDPEHKIAPENAAKLTQAPSEQRGESFASLEDTEGRDVSDLAFRHVEDDQVQVEIVKGQGFDDLTESDILDASTERAESFFAKGDETSEHQVGSRKAGEVTGQFALAASPITESAELQPESNPAEDKPFTITQQLNG